MGQRRKYGRVKSTSMMGETDYSKWEWCLCGKEVREVIALDF